MITFSQSNKIARIVLILLTLDCSYANSDEEYDTTELTHQYINYFLSNATFVPTSDLSATIPSSHLKDIGILSGLGNLVTKIMDSIPMIKNIINALEKRISIIVNKLMCHGCLGIMEAVIYVVRKLDMSDEILLNKLTVVCHFIMTYEVCAGVLSANLPILTYIIRNQPNATAKSFCGLWLQSADNICPTNDDRYEWTVEIPELPKNYVVRENNNLDLKIALISDIHLDDQYAPGSITDCNEPICCRNSESSSLVKLSVENNSSHVSKRSIFGNQPPGAGYWGDYRNCDTPVWTYQAIIEHMTLNQNVDVIYYLGDALHHFIWTYTYENLKHASAEVFEGLRKQFGSVPIISCIGNHEAMPVNQFAPISIQGPFNVTWLYEHLSNLWSPYLTSFQQNSMLERGGYSTLIRPGLRVISLNNNIASNLNWWMVYDPQEPKKHLEWFISELSAAEMASERVHILTHIPAGASDSSYTWSREYQRVIQRFSKTVIAAEFNGHTHSDEFKLYYDELGQPTLVAWNSGGTNAYQNFNLNYKIIKADGKTFDITSIKNYIFNMNDANLRPNQTLSWINLYDYQRDFDLADLSASSMEVLLHRMVQDRRLLKQYNEYFWKSSPEMFNCKYDCILKNICGNVETVLWDKTKCNELLQLYYYYNEN